MIKIGFVNYSLGVGGVETLILEISRKLDRSRFQPYIFVFEKNGKLKNEYLHSKIVVCEVDKKKGFDWLLPVKLSKMLKKHNIDIVHTHNPGNWLYGSIAARLTGIPVVHTEHTTSDYYNYHVKRWQAIESILAKFTHTITAVCENVKKHMVEKSHISSSKIKVIYNAIDVDNFNVEINKSKLAQDLSLDKNCMIIGSIARFYKNKDHKTLLEAFSVALKRIPNLCLLLVGDGPLRLEIEKLADDLKIAKNVKFLGNRRDVPEILKIMDVFVLSSIREGLPIALLEAMASGVPVVVTNVDGNSEVVINNETGLTVRMGDSVGLANAILQMLEDNNKARRLACNGQDLIRKKFSLNNMIKQYGQIYEEICIN